ncbi:hypothetical protein HD806DRAFT_467346 [Xylariaceae sp. AK1471]|nr:hypothetical protein HD806DRAFT_467346 [Xylariaceae sp. AK1471]
MATQPTEVEMAKPQVSEVQPMEVTLDSLFEDPQPMDFQLTEVEMAGPQGSEIQLVGAEAESQVMAVQPMDFQVVTEAQAKGVREVEAKAPEAQVPEVRVLEAQILGSKAVEAKATEVKAPQAKTALAKVKGGKSLAVKLAKIELAAMKPARTKPKEVKSTSAKPPSFRKDAKLSLADMLADSRKWVGAPDSYMIRNTYTGCWGMSVKKPDRARSEIKIAHAEDCECMDVRLMHICKHVDRLVKRGHIAKRFRDDLVIVIKIRRRLPQPVPKEVRFPALVGRVIIRRPCEEVNAEDKVRKVIESHNNQMLIENWKNLKAFKERLIWKDW